DAIDAALAVYEAERHGQVARIQDAARPSLSWWEHFGRSYRSLPPWQFAFHFFSRSLPESKLRQRDPAFVESVRQAWAAAHGGETDPLRTPVDIAGGTQPVRVVTVDDGAVRLAAGPLPFRSGPLRPGPGRWGAWISAPDTEDGLGQAREEVEREGVTITAVVPAVAQRWLAHAAGPLARHGQADREQAAAAPLRGLLAPVRSARREGAWNLGCSRGIDCVVRRVLGAPPSREAEFTEFVEAASARLLRAALVLLDTREEAEDALQLALLRTYRHWDRARQAPEAYSRTVLVNVCRERWRYRARHPQVTGVPDTSPQSVVTSFTEAVDRRHVLVRVLRRLPAVQREVLVFRYMLDASVADTAAALDIAEGTVKSAASRGLGQLRILLSAEYEDKKVRRVHPR
ncbi:MAG TPA: sigma-70 family RNA polymerase sigma factor, partial [Streptosporangiaceae bacterium]|nr:sigma-70 family RNA polymerase sigma factor [Streptosporangiaceae bacterium]